MKDAWHSKDSALAKRQLERLASSLAKPHPGAAASLREGLAETLTLSMLRIDGALYKTFRTTNPIENLNGLIAHYTRNVKRWRDGEMVMRWIGTALHEASGGFRAVRGYRDITRLIAALEVDDRRFDRARHPSSERAKGTYGTNRPTGTGRNRLVRCAACTPGPQLRVPCLQNLKDD